MDFCTLPYSVAVLSLRWIQDYDFAQINHERGELCPLFTLNQSFALQSFTSTTTGLMWYCGLFLIHFLTKHPMHHQVPAGVTISESEVLIMLWIASVIQYNLSYSIPTRYYRVRGLAVNLPIWIDINGKWILHIVIEWTVTYLCMVSLLRTNLWRSLWHECNVANG